MTTRRHRRAVGPPGARPPVEEPRVEPEPEREQPANDDERFLRERPPHHDQER